MSQQFTPDLYLTATSSYPLPFTGLPQTHTSSKGIPQSRWIGIGVELLSFGIAAIVYCVFVSVKSTMRGKKGKTRRKEEML
jgi:hypothetical protein